MCSGQLNQLELQVCSSLHLDLSKDTLNGSIRPLQAILGRFPGLSRESQLKFCYNFERPKVKKAENRPKIPHSGQIETIKVSLERSR